MPLPLAETILFSALVDVSVTDALPFLSVVTLLALMALPSPLACIFTTAPDNGLPFVSLTTIVRVIASLPLAVALSRSTVSEEAPMPGVLADG